MIESFLSVLPPEGRLLVVALGVEYGGVVMAVGADFVCGVAKARRAGVRRTSRGYRRTFDKLGRYLAALAGLTLVDAVILAAVACLRGSGGPMVPVVPVLTSLGAAGIALVEAKSICESAEAKDDLSRGAEMLERMIDMIARKRRELK